MNRVVSLLSCIAVAGLLGCAGASPVEPTSLMATESQDSQKTASAEQSEMAGSVWIHDDYDAALAKARIEGKPLVVDMWAKW